MEYVLMLAISAFSAWLLHDLVFGSRIQLNEALFDEEVRVEFFLGGEGSAGVTTPSGRHLGAPGSVVDCSAVFVLSPKL
jgi:hypothetical protein